MQSKVKEAIRLPPAESPARITFFGLNSSQLIFISLLFDIFIFTVNFFTDLQNMQIRLPTIIQRVRKLKFRGQFVINWKNRYPYDIGPLSGIYLMTGTGHADEASSMDMYYNGLILRWGDICQVLEDGGFLQFCE